MPVVKLNQSRPHSPLALFDRKRTLGINHIDTHKISSFSSQLHSPLALSDRKRTLGINHIHTHKISSFSPQLHLQPHSYIPLTVFTRPVPAPKSQHFSSLSNGSTGTSRGGPRSSSQPRASAQAGSSKTVQEKQDAKACDCYYTTQASTPEVTENLHLTTCHRGLLASLGPHP